MRLPTSKCSQRGIKMVQTVFCVSACLYAMARHVAWIIQVYSTERVWHADASSHIFSVIFSVCLCPPICVGLAGGQNNGELEELDAALYTSVLSG